VNRKDFSNFVVVWKDAIFERIVEKYASLCRKGARTREAVEIKYAEILSCSTALFTSKDEM